MRGNLLETIISAISHSIKCSSGAFLCRLSPPLMTGGGAPMTNTSYPYLPVDNMHELVASSNGSLWRMVQMRDWVTGYTLQIFACKCATILVHSPAVGRIGIRPGPLWIHISFYEEGERGERRKRIRGSS